MGLDMYLERKTYVKRWEHQAAGEKFSVIVKRGGKTYPNIDPAKVSYVTEEIAYWRKANQIHKWFTDNCAQEDWHGEGVYVSQSQLKELLSLCEQVIAGSKMVKGKVQNGSRGTEKGWEPIMEDGMYIEDDTLARELLPTESGFFFGSTNYDQYYMDDLINTVKMLKPYVDEGEGGEFEYSASW